MKVKENPYLFIFSEWIPLVFIATVLSVTFFLVIQQDLRESANDPQIQTAQETALAIAAGQPVLSVLPEQKVNISASLDPFIMVFGLNGQLIASSGTLNNTPPVFPASILSNAHSQGEESITWEPETGLRFAAVVLPFSGENQSGYVVVARSLTEVERLENMLGLDIFGGWIISVIGSYGIIFCFRRIGKEKVEEKVIKRKKTRK